ncbi:hypothetical protein M885DRAFT_528011 [Pelagophyceae sp. CCMP2097]|nr:hypothetical protein M885DRAFT_528011 [Pelagophyceae sp. CCMP2097]
METDTPAAGDNPFNDASVTREPTGGGNAPAWLDDVSVDAAPKFGRNSPGAAGAYAAAGRAGARADVRNDTNVARAPQPMMQPAVPRPGPTKEQQALLVTMRMLNVGVSALMSAAAVIALLSLPSFDTAIISLYIWFFAIMLCCFETHLKAVSKVIASNFGFLYHAKGRLLFLVLLATLCFGLGLLGLISGGFLLFAAGFNTYVICKYPGYESDQQRADIEQAGPATFGQSARDRYEMNHAGRGGEGASWLGAGVGAAGAWAVRNPVHAQAAGAAVSNWAQENPQAARSVAGQASAAF